MSSPVPSGSGTADRDTGPVTVGSALRWGVRALGGDRAARVEAAYLLAGVLDVTPGTVWLCRYAPLDAADHDLYRRRIERRQGGEPLQYIEGVAAFRDLRLRVGPAVLIPRPETEQLVQAVLDHVSGRPALTALDLGTGTGAIAISLATEGPFERIVAVDISRDALNVAEHNVKAAGISDVVELRAGSFFDPVERAERFDVIVSNPPYVSREEAATLPSEIIDWEPMEALISGPTGFEALETVIDRAPQHLRPGGLLALELGLGQAAHVSERLVGSFCARRLIDDLAGRPRIVLAEFDESVHSETV